MRFLRITSVMLLASMLAVGVADAKKKKGGDDAAETTEESAEDKYAAIEETGIKEWDDGTFADAKSIQETLTGWETSLGSVETQLRTAVGVAEDAPIATAMDDFKTQAADKISIEVVNGTELKVGAKDGAELPENLQTGVDALNEGVATARTIIAEAPELKTQVQGLLESAKSMPSTVTPDLLSSNGLKVKDLKTVKNAVGNNVTALKQTPDRVQGIMDSATSMMDFVKSLKPE